MVAWRETVTGDWGIAGMKIERRSARFGQTLSVPTGRRDSIPVRDVLPESLHHLEREGEAG